MKLEIIKLENSSKMLLINYLNKVEADFNPPLISRIEDRSNVVGVEEYAKKLLQNANVFAYQISEDEIIAVIAIYTNDTINRNAYIPILSVHREWSGKGLASKLVEHSVLVAKTNSMKKVSVKTWSSNVRAISLYTKLNFDIKERNDLSILFEKTI